MSASSEKANIHFPECAGGLLPASPADGEVSQYVRGCTATAETSTGDYWSLAFERTDLNTANTVVLHSPSESDDDGPFMTTHEWQVDGTLRIFAYGSDGEGGFERTTDLSISFSVRQIPNY